MAKRPDYQNPDDNLDEITDKRNAEIRAWGKQQLAESDAILLARESDSRWSDWEQLDDDVKETKIVDAEVESPAKTGHVDEEPIEAIIQEQQIPDTESGKTTPKPRTKAKPA